MSRSVLLRMRNVSDKSCREKSKHILCSITFFENLAVNEIMWENIIQSSRPQMTIWHKLIEFWIPTATNKHSEYVMLISYPLQQWMHKSASYVIGLRTLPVSFLTSRPQ